MGKIRLYLNCPFFVFKSISIIKSELARWISGKESCLCRRHEFYPWVGKIPWRQPPPVFLLGKSHGQRSLVGYSPWGRKTIRQFSDKTVYAGVLSHDVKKSFFHMMSQREFKKSLHYTRENKRHKNAHFLPPWKIVHLTRTM